jgi:thioredoxin-related protein
MVRKKYFFLVFILFSLCSAKVTPTGHDKLLWMNWKELAPKMNNETKPVIMDLYTNWCYWCKVMEKKTYANSKVIAYINEHFYAVKFDAESKEVVEWRNKQFNFNEAYKINDFAMYVTNGQPGFPTMVIFPDEKSEPIAVSGYMQPKEIEPILKYFGEGAYKKESFNDFQSTFKAAW